MNKVILAQILEEFVKDVFAFFSAGEVKTLVEMERELNRMFKECVLRCMRAYIESVDRGFVENKSFRKQEGLAIDRRNDKRDVYTIFGNLTFERTYFYDKRDKSYTYLADSAIGLRKYERMTDTVGVALVENASSYSYAKSSDNVTGGDISKSTVMNKVHSLQGLKVESDTPKRRVSVLHIDADEDYVSLQNGKKAIVPLVCIYEGVSKEGSRNRCMNTTYISGYGKDVEELWLETAEWVYSSYEVEKIERIYIHGDGARWIKEGVNWLPTSKLVLDKYHLNKAILSGLKRHPDERRSVYRAIKTEDLDSFKAAMLKASSCAKDEAERKKISELRRYVTNNWDSIIIHGQEDCGSQQHRGSRKPCAVQPFK